MRCAESALVTGMRAEIGFSRVVLAQAFRIVWKKPAVGWHDRSGRQRLGAARLWFSGDIGAWAGRDGAPRRRASDRHGSLERPQSHCFASNPAGPTFKGSVPAPTGPELKMPTNQICLTTAVQEAT